MYVPYPHIHFTISLWKSFSSSLSTDPLDVVPVSPLVHHELLEGRDFSEAQVPSTGIWKTLLNEKGYTTCLRLPNLK